jgi:hypothetical protein
MDRQDHRCQNGVLTKEEIRDFKVNNHIKSMISLKTVLLLKKLMWMSLLGSSNTFDLRHLFL